SSGWFLTASSVANSFGVSTPLRGPRSVFVSTGMLFSFSWRRVTLTAFRRRKRGRRVSDRVSRRGNGTVRPGGRGSADGDRRREGLALFGGARVVYDRRPGAVVGQAGLALRPADRLGVGAREDAGRPAAVDGEIAAEDPTALAVEALGRACRGL